jgi:hypothetical protein
VKIKRFSEFLAVLENSDLDWSDKSWGEVDQDGVNPPNSGFEGTSAEKMDFSAGDYGDLSDEEILIDDDAEEKIENLEDSIKSLKSMVDDLEERIYSLEKKIKI